MKRLLPAFLVLLFAAPVYILGFAIKPYDWAEGMRLVIAATAFGLGPAIAMACLPAHKERKAMAALD